MSSVPRRGDLQIHEDPAYQRREWVFERVGWAVMALLVLAALLGLLGPGPLSSTSVSDGGGASRVEYDRFLHHHAPTTLHGQVAGDAARAGELRLWVDLEYLAAVEVQQITPRPDHVEAGSDRHLFVFRVAEPDRPTRVTFRLEPDRIGWLAGRMGVGDGAPARFRQLVYP